MNDPIQILLIGKTGHGKSQLGNFLLQDKNAFVVSAGSDSETILTEKKTVGNVTIIDSPGLLDSKGRDNQHYKQMISSIKCLTKLNGILIVINSQETRLSSELQDMIRTICNNFNFETIKNNIGFVFTKYFGKEKYKKEIKKGKEEEVLKCEEIIENFYNKKLGKHIKMFFIDSDLDERDENSLQTRIEIMMWIRELTYVNCQELEIKDNINHKREFYKTDKKENETEDKNFTYRTVIKLRKKFAINLKNEEIPLGDWEEYDKISYKIPKKKSLWQKVLGIGFIVGGVIAAPFSAGATLTGVAAGVTMIKLSK